MEVILISDIMTAWTREEPWRWWEIIRFAFGLATEYEKERRLEDDSKVYDLRN